MPETDSQLLELSSLLRNPLPQTPIRSFSSDVYYFQRYFSDEQVLGMLADGTAINGNCGGLIVGRSHDQGGIPVLMSMEGGGYKLNAEFEGYEYLLNPGVLILFQKECEAINQPGTDRKPEFTEYTPAAGISVLDVRTDNHPHATKYLVLDGSISFFVVNRGSTTIRLDILERMNQSITYEQWKWARDKAQQAD